MIFFKRLITEVEKLKLWLNGDTQRLFGLLLLHEEDLNGSIENINGFVNEFVK